MIHSREIISVALTITEGIPFLIADGRYTHPRCVLPGIPCLLVHTREPDANQVEKFLEMPEVEALTYWRLNGA